MRGFEEVGGGEGRTNREIGHAGWVGERMGMVGRVEVSWESVDLAGRLGSSEVAK